MAGLGGALAGGSSGSLSRYRPFQRRLSIYQSHHRIWTPDQLKLLYLISCFGADPAPDDLASQTGECATQPATQHDKRVECWIRRLPLGVFVYEGIVRGVFTYDYGPQPTLFGAHLILLNVSQECTGDLDQLQEGSLVQGLKLATRHYQCVSAFRVTAEGHRVLRSRVSDAMRGEVDALVYRPDSSAQERLSAVYRHQDQSFYLCCAGYSRRSTVTDCEDVSYVSSPYLPQCVRRAWPDASSPLSATASSRVATLTSNAHLAAQCLNTIRDESLHEIISLADVDVILGEYVPFGSNQIAALTDRLGIGERLQQGLVTAQIDAHSATTRLYAEPGMTRVRTLDVGTHGFLNFEAQIVLPPDVPTSQIEHFGVHARDNGAVYAGIRIESVFGRPRDSVSLDLLSRVMWTLHLDSSSIIDSLLSQYQRSLIDMLYHGQSALRHKMFVLFASDISPHFPAASYLDRDERENELRQVLGELRGAHDLPGKALLFLGERGALIVTRQRQAVEPYMLDYTSLHAMTDFLNEVVRRIFALTVMVDEVREQVDAAASSSRPHVLADVQQQLNQISKDVAHLREVLSFISDSLRWRRAAPPPESELQHKLEPILLLEDGYAALQRRIADLDKNMVGTITEIQGLRETTDVMSQTAVYRMQQSVSETTRRLEGGFRGNLRSGNLLGLLQVLFSGTLSFQILDRLTGSWTIIDQPWASTWFQPILAMPGAWFLVNVVFWLVLAAAVVSVRRRAGASKDDVITLRLGINKTIDLAALAAFLQSRRVLTEAWINDASAGADSSRGVRTDAAFAAIATPAAACPAEPSHRLRVGVGRTLRKMSWRERDPGTSTVAQLQCPDADATMRLWLSWQPVVEIIYDPTTAVLVSAYLQVARRDCQCSSAQLQRVFMSLLLQQQILRPILPARVKRRVSRVAAA